MKLKHFLLTALILFTGVSGTYATKRTVGFSSGNSHANLAAALSGAGLGDTVFVAVGLYLADNAEFTVPENVVLIGGYDKTDITQKTRRYPGQFVPFDSSVVNQTQFTILDGNSYQRSLASQKHRVITVQKDGVVDGCLIRNGHVRNKNGGGVLLNGGKLYNSIVRGNVAMNHPDSAEALGGGVFIQQGGELINCLVAYNMANDGYGVAAGQGGGKMINNTITANTYSPVFAKILGGTFKMYELNNSLNYRSSGAIPKRDLNITLTDFYISRILTTQGQYAVFCAAMDILKSGNSGMLDMTTLKGLTEPIRGGTLENYYKFNGITGPGEILKYSVNANGSGLKYDDGVWHPIVDTVTVEYPMGNINRYGAMAYAVWLGGGLPSQAQWEFAARREPDGTVNDNLYSGAYGTTDSKDTVTWRILDTIAWVANSMSINTATGKLGVSGTNRPHEVARKRPNAMGIYDMTGNMYEWCADFRRDTPTLPSSPDPIDNNIATYVVVRGGSYSNVDRNAFSLTSRPTSSVPASASDDVGVRPIVAF